MAPSGWNLVQSGKAGKQHQAKLSGKAPGGAKAIRRARPLGNDHLSHVLGDSRVMAKAFKRWQQACWGSGAHLSSEEAEEAAAELALTACIADCLEEVAVYKYRTRCTAKAFGAWAAAVKAAVKAAQAAQMQAMLKQVMLEHQEREAKAKADEEWKLIMMKAANTVGPQLKGVWRQRMMGRSAGHTRTAAIAGGGGSAA